MRQEFIVHGMTCQHCVTTITRAVLRLDGSAAVSIDLSQQRVTVESDVGRERLSEAILDEGFAVA